MMRRSRESSPSTMWCPASTRASSRYVLLHHILANALMPINWLGFSCARAISSRHNSHAGGIHEVCQHQQHLGESVEGGWSSGGRLRPSIEGGNWVGVKVKGFSCPSQLPWCLRGCYLEIGILNNRKRQGARSRANQCSWGRSLAE